MLVFVNKVGYKLRVKGDLFMPKTKKAPMKTRLPFDARSEQVHFFLHLFRENLDGTYSDDSIKRIGAKALVSLFEVSADHVPYITGQLSRGLSFGSHQQVENWEQDTNARLAEGFFQAGHV